MNTALKPSRADLVGDSHPYAKISPPASIMRAKKVIVPYPVAAVFNSHRRSLDMLNHFEGEETVKGIHLLMHSFLTQWLKAGTVVLSKRGKG